MNRDWLAVARKHKLVTLLDAAADTPPLERLWEYTRMGYDLVAFSGGKAIGGPQPTGILLGRRDQAEDILRPFSFGEQFLTLNRKPLEAYEEATSNAELVELQWEFFDKPPGQQTGDQ